MAAEPPKTPTSLGGTPGSAKRYTSTTYIPQEGFENLHSYQYHGQDKSLIYQHVLTPMNKVLIEFFPRWMAPNVITVLGLFCVMVSHVLMLYYAPGLEGQGPAWVYVFNGLMLLAYQTLDNLDGRQARRVGASSPLGLFFDHGCDALNCTVGSLTLMAATQMGASWKAVAILLSTIFTFYLNTWEEYYTGELILPVINGPTEGLLVGTAIHLWTAYTGPNWWRNTIQLPVPVDAFLELDAWLTAYLPDHERFSAQLRKYGTVTVQYNGLIAIFMLIGSIFTLIGNLITVFRAVHRNAAGAHGKYSDTWLAQKMPFAHACTRLLPFLAFTVLAITWIVVSPTEILKRHPRLVFWTIGLLFAKVVTHLMIAHLCSVEYHPLRRTLMPFYFFAAHVALSWANKAGELQVNEELILLEFFALALVSYCHLTWGCIQEFKAVLGIHCFRITPKRSD
eukprot:EG_transcript_8907